MDIVMRIAGGLVILFVLYMSMNEIYKAICKRRESKKKYKVILDDLCNKLKSCNAEYILTKSDFKLDRKYYNAIKPGKYITEYVEEMASEILAHIGIKENVDVVVLYDNADRFNSVKEESGYYRSNRKNRDIHIVVKKDYKCSDVAAILCHEISHMYMEIMNIEYEDKSRNEEATDVIAIMLGFGKILIYGYCEHQYEEEIGIGLTKIHKSKIGYISSTDCKIVYALVKELRNNEQLAKQEQTALDEIRNIVVEKLKLSKEIIEQFLIIVQNLKIDTVDVNVISKFQELYIQIENKYFETKIKQCEIKLKNNLKKAELVEIIEQLDSICYEITMNSSFLQNHLNKRD